MKSHVRHGNRSVSWDRLVDRQTPRVDSAGHALRASKSVLPQKVSDTQAADAMVAVYDNVAFTMVVQFMQPIADFSHWNQHAAFDAGDFVFAGLSNVQQQKIVSANL